MGQIEIINLALVRIGANPITSLADNTTEQVAAVQAWDIARKYLLRSHPWNFAIANVELSALVNQTPFRYTKAYQLPSDCIRLLECYGNNDFKVEGRLLWTNAETCKVRYIRDIQDSTEWDGMFADVFAQRLASDLAYALTKSQSTADSAYAIYDRKLKIARHIDSTEDIQDAMGGDSSYLIGARY